MSWNGPLPLPIVLGAVLDFVQMGLPSILPKVKGQGLDHSIVHCELSVELQRVYAIIFSEVYTTIIPRKGEIIESAAMKQTCNKYS